MGMKKMDPSAKVRVSSGFGPVLLLLTGVLVALFARAALPDYTVFSNDGPLGAISARFIAAPASFTGMWQDLNWVGTNGGALPPNLSGLLFWVLGPLGFSKIYAPFSLLFVGLSAWFCLRQFRFAPLACLLGGLAATLNADFFATACWGVCSQPIAFGLNFLALGLLADLTSPHRWIRVMLAGFAVGLGVMEAYDIGALFSLAVAAFVVVQAFNAAGSPLQRAGRGLARLALVATCAGLIAATTLLTLVMTQVKGVVGMAQDEATRARRWHEATQWSIPKREALGLFVPGLFGFRMDTPDGGAYWGGVGRDAAWDRYLASDRQGPVPGGFFRYGGGSTYAGMLVLLGAAWAVAQSFRRRDSFFSPAERRLIWFWLAVVIVSALLMFGRFAPFYQFFYALPYASTIRNPAKFLHILMWALVVLSGYGWHGLTTLYLKPAAPAGRALVAQVSAWWKQVAGFERRWVIGLWAAVGGALLAGLLYAAQRETVVAYLADLNRLQEMQRGLQPDPVAAHAAAQATIGFSLGQVVWAVGFLVLAAGLLTLIMSGYFHGRRTRIAAGLLVVVLALDLGWQNRPFAITLNWREKYVEAGQNPVIALLQQDASRHRVSNVPEWIPRAFQLDPQLARAEEIFQSVYGMEWTQHLFPYYNIQTLNVVQMPRRPLEYEAFEQALQFDFTPDTLHHVIRRWQLSNTRYLVAAAPMAEVLNQIFAAGAPLFQTRLQFEFYQTRNGGPILTRTNQQGPFALIEFTDALPRARLFTDWQVAAYDPARMETWTNQLRRVFPPGQPLALDALATNDLATLALLTRKTFDPTATVLLAEPLSISPTTNAPPGSVDYVSYTPKHIVFETQSAVPAVLLLNDKYDPNWQVTVDGQPAALLRCNYLMRGVAVPAGDHRVEFQFAPPRGPLYVSLAAIALGGLFLGILIIPRRRPES